ncbi:hypothetical protein B0T10DRAFT_417749, partial [Thelonectria olida]
TFRKEAESFRLRREAEAMSYVRSHTSVPVASIFDEDEAWPATTEIVRARMISELQSYLNQLHRLRPTGPSWVGSCSGRPAYDHRPNNRSECDPFKSIAEFHDCLVAPGKRCPRPGWVAKYRNKLPDDHDIVFAHADISWENILVDPTTASVTGIVDLEMAGFWPEWCEYREALFGARSEK